MATGAFAYNDRVAAALLPALVVFAGVAESAVLGIIVVRRSLQISSCEMIVRARDPAPSSSSAGTGAHQL